MDNTLLDFKKSQKSYKKQYVIGLLFIALIAIFARVLFDNGSLSQELFGKVINISGKQRMLSQKAAFLSNELIHAPIDIRPKIQKSLSDVTNQLLENHSDLLNGNIDRNIPQLTSIVVSDIYFSEPYMLDRKIRIYVNRLNEITSLSNDILNVDVDVDVDAINNGEAEDILLLLDEVVTQFQLENKEAVTKLENTENIFLTLLLVSLGLVGVGIFRPMLRDVGTTGLELLNKEMRLRAIIDHAVDALISISDVGIVLSFNPSAERLFGYKSSEVIGKNISMLMPDNHKTAHDNYLKKYCETGDGIIIRQGIEANCKRNNGSQFPADILVNEVVMPSGEIIFFGIIRDITTRKNTEESLKSSVNDLSKANEELERFTYTVSHDLKSPLVSINGFIGILEEDIANNDEDSIANSLQFIKGAATKMHGLINDLLELSRVGIKEGERVKISFNDLIPEVLITLTEHIQSRNATVDIAENMPLVEVEKVRFDEVFLNLIENGLKYMDTQTAPHIEIGVEIRKSSKERPETVFYVKDNGRGLKPEDCEHVFEIFERVAVDVEGTGVGLAIVKRIIETHDGRIWVESEGTGKGATFYFVIPTAEEQS